MKIDKFWKSQYFYVALGMVVMLLFMVAITNDINSTNGNDDYYREIPRELPKAEHPILDGDERQLDPAYKTLVGDLLYTVNQERTNRNLSVVMSPDVLCDVALEHSDYMSCEGKTSLSWMLQGEPYFAEVWATDNLLITGEQIALKMMESPRRNIKLLYPDITHAGIGITFSDKGTYATWVILEKEVGETDRRYMRGLPIYYFEWQPKH